jgi:putative transposase
MQKARSPKTPNSPPCPATLEGLPHRARKTLQHEIPDWVGDGAVLFITINCKPRGQNQLAQPTRVDAIERSLHHQQSSGAWWVHLLLLMPDHLHALVSFPRQATYRRAIQNWKRFLARQLGIVWQRDFFDHRLRNDDSLTEKWAYIRNNPVRKGLVSAADDWPYQWAFPVGTDLRAVHAHRGAFGESALPSEPYPVSPTT